jgi:hypothetical protein
VSVRVLRCAAPERRSIPGLVYWNQQTQGWGRFDEATRFEADRPLPDPAWPGGEVTWMEDLPRDRDGFPYVVDEHIGPWRVTHCCAAAVSINDGTLYCKSCYAVVDLASDTPARLDADWRPGDGPIQIRLPPHE